MSGLAPLPGLTEDYTNYHPQAGPYEIANIPYGYTAESGVGITQEMIYQVPQKEENLEEGGGGSEISVDLVHPAANCIPDTTGPSGS